MQGQPSQRSQSRARATNAGPAARVAPGPASPIDAPTPLGGMNLVDRSAPPQRFKTIGGIDGLIGMAVLGWAYDRDFGRRRVKITMFVNDQLVLEAAANGLRRELVGIGGHDGFSGFICAIPPERFSAGASIRVFGDGTELTAEPLVLGPTRFDGIFEPIAGAVATGWVRERVREPSRARLEMYIHSKLEPRFPPRP